MMQDAIQLSISEFQDILAHLKDNMYNTLTVPNTMSEFYCMRIKYVLIPCFLKLGIYMFVDIFNISCNLTSDLTTSLNTTVQLTERMRERKKQY